MKYYRLDGRDEVFTTTEEYSRFRDNGNAILQTNVRTENNSYVWISTVFLGDRFARYETLAFPSVPFADGIADIPMHTTLDSHETYSMSDAQLAHMKMVMKFMA